MLRSLVSQLRLPPTVSVGVALPCIRIYRCQHMEARCVLSASLSPPLSLSHSLPLAVFCFRPRLLCKNCRCIVKNGHQGVLGVCVCLSVCDMCRVWLCYFLLYPADGALAVLLVLPVATRLLPLRSILAHVNLSTVLRPHCVLGTARRVHLETAWLMALFGCQRDPFWPDIDKRKRERVGVAGGDDSRGVIRGAAALEETLTPYKSA